MNHKVLLADDSLTIQKVIKITLANQPYDIVECASDDELFNLLPQVKPELVFLDFNLSEKYTGYELSSKIKEAVPSARILLLLGTFDTVDDSAMERSGASDKIVKPFDSNKFISICKRLIDSAPLEPINFPELKESQQLKPKEEDQWEVNHTIDIKPSPEKKPELPKAFDVREHLNPLDQEVSDWGMSVPGIINDKSSTDKIIDLPPVIGDVKVSPSAEIISLNSAKSALSVSSPAPSPANDDIKYPATDDLDYPTIEELTDTSKSSNVISVDSFTQNSGIEFEIEHSINSVQETDISSLEAQIRDEVEENLWQADEFEDLKRQVAEKFEEVKKDTQAPNIEFNDSYLKPLDENEEIQWTSAQPSTASTISAEDVMGQIRPEMELLIKKHVKEYMDKIFEEKIEKIAWEVIPDLAENIIRKELSKISSKVLND
jgi:DNA-binding response OmpR family regulator